jgi:hypothetical protein
MYRVFINMVRHQVQSGLSLGVFEKDYQFKDPSSATTGGKLHWPFNDNEYEKPAKTEQALLDKMDFPLVSVILAFDSQRPIPGACGEKIEAVLPWNSTRAWALNARDKRGTENLRKWRRDHRVLCCGGSSTRRGCVGNGLIKALAWRMMRQAKEKGFGLVEIDSMHDAVSKVWENPPDGMRAVVLAQWKGNELDGKEDPEGYFVGVEQEMKRILVELKNEVEDEAEAGKQGNTVEGDAVREQGDDWETETVTFFLG